MLKYTSALVILWVLSGFVSPVQAKVCFQETKKDLKHLEAQMQEAVSSFQELKKESETSGAGDTLPKPAVKRPYISNKRHLEAAVPLLMQQHKELLESLSVVVPTRTIRQDSSAIVKQQVPKYRIDPARMLPFIPKKVGSELYVLSGILALWLLFRFLFRDLYQKIMRLTRQALFRFNYEKSLSLVANFRFEIIFLRFLSLWIFTYAFYFFLGKNPQFTVWIAELEPQNPVWFMLRIFSMLLGFYILRFLWLSVVNNREIAQLQLMFHSALSIGISVAVFLLLLVLSVVQPTYTWYSYLHLGTFCFIVYAFGVKGLIVIRAYLAEAHFRTLFFVYLLVFELTLPVSLLYLYLNDYFPF